MKNLFICLLLTLALILSGCDIIIGGNDQSDTEAGTSLPEASAPDKPSDPTEAPTFSGDECDTHTDSDDNGSCDVCAVSVMVTVDLYAINDLHGKFSDTDSDEGVDELTAYLKKAYASDDHYITLSSGDMWQGGSESNLTKGLIITEWLNHIGAVSMTLGNHEYDWGEEYIYNNAEIAEFPFLAINVYDRATNQPVDYCAPSVVIERGGIQIGIIGAIGDCYSSIAPDKVEDIYFKVDGELTQLVKDESERLRAQGVDYIIYSLHDGYGQSKSGTTSISSSKLSSYYSSELSSGGYVDLVFEGHTHQNYVMKDTYGVYHLQNGGDNRGISHAEVKINSVTNSSTIIEAEFIEDDTYMYLSDDGIVDELREKYKEQIALGDEVIGTNRYYRNSDYLRQLVADLYYESGIELWGDEYDIVLGGGFISVRSPYHLEAGDVKYSQLQSLFPFDNHLVLCSIKGYDLKNRFINSTNDNYFVSYEDGLLSSINDSATYYIIVDSYSSSYAPNRLTEIARYELDVFARDLLAEYIKNGGLA